MNGMDWCGVWDGEKKGGGKRGDGKEKDVGDVGRRQNPGTVKEECQGQGECLMSVTSTLSLFEKNKSHESSCSKHDFATSHGKLAKPVCRSWTFRYRLRGEFFLCYVTCAQN